MTGKAQQRGAPRKPKPRRSRETAARRDRRSTSWPWPSLLAADRPPAQDADDRPARGPPPARGLRDRRGRRRRPRRLVQPPRRRWSPRGASAARARTASGSRTTSPAGPRGPAGPSASTAGRSRRSSSASGSAEEIAAPASGSARTPACMIDFLGDRAPRRPRRGTLGPWTKIARPDAGPASPSGSRSRPRPATRSCRSACSGRPASWRSTA